MKWKFRSEDFFEPFIQLRTQTYLDKGYNAITAKVLALRDIEPDQAYTLMCNPASLVVDSDKIPGCEEAANAIIHAIESKKDIFIYADYDVDGLTSGYIMTMFIYSLGNRAKVRYPERKDGYGLSLEYVQSLTPGSVVITVDNGINAFEAIDYCNKHDIQVIVTDHHEPKEKLPNCILCDPFLDMNGYGHHLCGAAVAWKVCKRIQEITGRGNVNSFLPYVAIGTISDVMPMTLENQALVRLGLSMISKESTPVFHELMRVYNLHDISVSDISWKIAPLLNACSRLGNTKLAAELLFHRGDLRELHQIIQKIDQLNEQRRKETNRAVEEIKDIDFSQDNVCIFDATDYPHGIAGIIANRIMDMYHKPAIVYTRGDKTTYTASSRSPGINMLPLYEKEKQLGHIVNYGGHSQACGLSLLHDIDTFKKSLNQQLDEVEFVSTEPEYIIDTEIYFEDLTKQNFISLNKFPADKEVFPEAKFIIRDLNVVNVKTSNNNSENICFTLVDKQKTLKDLWAWRMGTKYKNMGSPKRIDIVGVLSWGFGNSSDKVVFSVEDIRSCN